MIVNLAGNRAKRGEMRVNSDPSGSNTSMEADNEMRQGKPNTGDGWDEDTSEENNECKNPNMERSPSNLGKIIGGNNNASNTLAIGEICAPEFVRLNLGEETSNIISTNASYDDLPAMLEVFDELPYTQSERRFHHHSGVDSSVDISSSSASKKKRPHVTSSPDILRVNSRSAQTNFRALPTFSSLEIIREYTRVIIVTYLIYSVTYRATFFPSYGFFQIKTWETCVDIFIDIFFVYEVLTIIRDRTQDQSYKRNIWLKIRNSVIYNVRNIDYKKASIGWKTKAAIHIIALFPLDLVAYLVNARYPSLYRLNRLLRVFNLPEYVENVVFDLESRNLLTDVYVQRMLAFYYFMVTASHCCTCIFYLIGKNECDHGNVNNWLYIDKIAIFDDASGSVAGYTLTKPPFDIYCRGMYWALVTMITTGFGDVVPHAVPEIIWCMITIFIGYTITTLSIANLTLLVANDHSAQTQYDMKMDSLGKYMKYRSLPKWLSERILSFYDFQWQNTEGVNEKEFLSRLPQNLQQEVVNCICRELLKNIPILPTNLVATDFLSALASKIEILVYCPQDILLRPGDPYEALMICSRGELVMKMESEKVIVDTKLVRGDYFGIESLFKVHEVSNKIIHTKTYCEILRLSPQNFQDIISDYFSDRDYKKLQTIALSKNKEDKELSIGHRTSLYVKEDFTNTPKGFNHPGSDFRKFWDVLMLAILMYYAIMAPYEFSRILGGFEDFKSIIYVNVVVDLLYATDLYVRSRCFLHYEEGVLIQDSTVVWQKWKNEHNIYIAVISTFPFELCLLFIDWRWVGVTRLPKLLRLHEIHFFSKMTREALDVNSDSVLLRFLQLNTYMLLGCHWIGCIWLFVGKYSQKYLHEQESWIKSDIVQDYQYFRAVYWALVGMSTVGYGDIIAKNEYETAFSILVILVGGLLLPAIVGGLSALIGSIDLSGRLFKAKMEGMNKFIKRKKLNDSLRSSIHSYYNYVESQLGGLEEKKFLNEFPITLRQQVAQHIIGEHVRNIPFFKNIESGMLKNIISVMTPRIYMPLAAIVKAGELGDEMYVIERGEVLITSPDNSISFAILESGNFFGEGCLLRTIPRNSNAYARSYCDCFVLTRRVFDEATRIHPEQRGDILRAVQSSLRDKVSANMNVVKNLETHAKAKNVLIGSEYKTNHATHSLMFPHDLVSSHYSRHHSSGHVSRTFSSAHSLYMANSSRGKMHLKSEGNSTHNGFIFNCLCSYLKSAASNIKLWNRFVFHPDSNYIQLWQGAIYLTVLYSICSISFVLAFTPEPTSYFLSWGLDIIFILDIYLNMDKFGKLNSGRMILQKSEIKDLYFQSGFKVDLFVAIPFDVLSIFLFAFDKKLLRYGMAILRVPKLARIFKLERYRDSFLTLLEVGHITSDAVKLVELILGILVISHIAGCGFIMVARYHEFYDHCALGGNFVTKFDICDWTGSWVELQINNLYLPSQNMSRFDLWLRAFYWALPSLVVVVIGDVIPVNIQETAYVFTWIVVGMTVNSAIIGKLANMVAGIEQDKAEFISWTDDMKNYMGLHEVPHQIEERVSNFMNHVWSACNGVQNDESQIDELPRTLRMSVAEQHKVLYIKSCPIFDSFSKELVLSLALSLKKQIFSPGDTILSYGEFGKEMYFLASGECQVISGDGETIFASIRGAGFFGETALFFKEKRSATIRASQFTCTYVLTKENLEMVLFNKAVDWKSVLKAFTYFKTTNDARNKAITNNLNAAKIEGSTLNKLISNGDETRNGKTHLPGSLFRAGWSFAKVMLTIYSLIAIPIQGAFIISVRENIVWLVVGFMVDLFFIFDMYQNLLNFSFMRHGVLYTDRIQIAKTYVRGSLVIDLISSIPYEIFAIFIGTRSIFLLRLFHLPRFFALPYMLVDFENFLAIRKSRISAPKSLILHILIYLVITVNWFGCCWFFIHRFLETSNDRSWAVVSKISTFDYSKGEHDVCSTTKFQCYITSIYFAQVTLCTVGYGDIRPNTNLETIFEALTCLMGACITAAVIGTFGISLKYQDESGSQSFRIKMRKLHRYMKYRGLPVHLQHAILSHFRKMQDSMGTVDEQGLLSQLPPPLRIDLMSVIRKPLLNSIPILSCLNKNIVSRIAEQLRPQTVPAGFCIYQSGDVGWDIYFIGKGEISYDLHVVNPAEIRDIATRTKVQIIQVLEANKRNAFGKTYLNGFHFGEYCLFSQSGIRRGNAKAMVESEVFYLSKQSLHRVLEYEDPQTGRSFVSQLITNNWKHRHTSPVDQVVKEVESLISQISAAESQKRKENTYTLDDTIHYADSTSNKGKRKSKGDHKKNFSFSASQAKHVSDPSEFNFEENNT